MSLPLQLYRLYLRAPEHPAKHRVERWLGARLFPEGGSAFAVHKNLKMYLHPGDWIEYLLLRQEQYEPLTLAFMEANIRAGQVAVLAGVNFGLHVMVASRCVAANGCVIGVEPEPKSLYRAYRNFLLNDLPQNIRLVSGALGDKCGFVPIDDAPSHNSGSASLRTSSSKYPFYVHIARLDALLEEFDCDSVDFMLLDVEGYEVYALRGISEEFRPALLLVEVNPTVLKGVGMEQKEIYDLILSMGYTCWSLHGELVKPNDELPEQNLVAIRNGTQTPRWVQSAISTLH